MIEIVVFLTKPIHFLFFVFVTKFVAKLTQACRDVAPKTTHKRNNAVANERFKKNR